MSVRSSELTIFARSFRERQVGKWLAQSKVKSEYSIVINYIHEVRIEITNSRLSRKKKIIMNGEVVESFKHTRSVDLRYSWTYPVYGSVVVFSISPNVGGSGSDLRINGQDFFEFVYEVESDNPLGLTKRSFEAFMIFKIPPCVGEASPEARQRFSMVRGSLKGEDDPHTLPFNSKQAVSGQYHHGGDSDSSSD
jgi:hypothetical protein